MKSADAHRFYRNIVLTFHQKLYGIVPWLSSDVPEPSQNIQSSKKISISFEEFDVKQNCFGTSESKPWTPRNQKMWCFAVPGLWSTAPGTISKCWCFGMLVFIKNIEIVQHGPVEFCCPLKNQTISCHACVLRQNCGEYPSISKAKWKKVIWIWRFENWIFHGCSRSRTCRAACRGRYGFHVIEPRNPMKK